jgi:hypothetical protein
MISVLGVVLVGAELGIKLRSCRSLGQRIDRMRPVLWRAVKYRQWWRLCCNRALICSASNIGVFPISHLQYHTTARSISATHLSFHPSSHSLVPIKLYLHHVVRASPQCSENDQAEACRVGTC